jgi:hypothetical protein
MGLQAQLYQAQESLRQQQELGDRGDGADGKGEARVAAMMAARRGDGGGAGGGSAAFLLRGGKNTGVEERDRRDKLHIKV